MAQYHTHHMLLSQINGSLLKRFTCEKNCSRKLIDSDLLAIPDRHRIL